MPKLRTWKVVLILKTAKGDKEYLTEVDAFNKDSAIVLAKREVQNEYTVKSVKSAEKKC